MHTPAPASPTPPRHASSSARLVATLLGGSIATAVTVASANSGAAAAPPTPALSAYEVMQLPAPPVRRYVARDRAALAYRVFASATSAEPRVVAILMHGSAGSSRNMTLVGGALASAGVPAFAPDVRGQGLSGRRGDVDYIGQPEDDLADFLPTVRQAYPNARLVLVGHSAGGGFVLRVAADPLGRQFSRFVLLDPYLGRAAPSDNATSGYAQIDLPRILALTALTQIGITGFNGAPVLAFSLPPQAEAVGATRVWSYRMMMSYGPGGQMQLFGEPAYRCEARAAPAPIVLIAGARDEEFHAERYAEDFKGLKEKVSVTLVPGVDHMGVLSDRRSVPLIVRAVAEGE
ncbi:MAG TPA: alpha/beta fold hydrolase [Caulobacteraceae bacterium]|nr:alpha/beta fold hydrolase [Caulobacteraceae bacterium]